MLILFETEIRYETKDCVESWLKLSDNAADESTDNYEICD